MKRILVTSTMLLFAMFAICGTRVFSDEPPISVVTLVDATAIAGSATYTTADLNVKNVAGYFSIELVVAGAGTAQVAYQTSMDGTTFTTPQGATALMTGKTVGTYIDQVVLEFAPYIRFLVSETGGGSAINATLKVAIQ